MSSADPRRHGRRRAFSRRTCLSALVAAATAPMASPARAQIQWHKLDIWKPYRREDLGFEVEMPGEPEIDIEEDEDGKSINAEFLFVGMMFGATHRESKRVLSVADVSAHQRNIAQRAKGRIMRETSFSMDGLPAIEIVSELEDAFVCILRAVVIGNRLITVDVIGGPDIAADPSALRFLNSFRLLSVARSK
jgi:hypothetical protein